MRRLTQTPFFGLVRAGETPVDPVQLEAALCEFTDALVSLTTSGEPFPLRYNVITFTLAELEAIGERVASSGSKKKCGAPAASYRDGDRHARLAA